MRTGNKPLPYSADSIFIVRSAKKKVFFKKLEFVTFRG